MAKPLVDDDVVIQTFFDVLDTLKEKRRKREITVEDFAKGLLEVAASAEKFINYEGSFTDFELQIQTGILIRVIEALCEILKDVGCRLGVENRCRELRDRYRRGIISLRDYWKGLLKLSLELFRTVHDCKIPPEKLRFILPVILSLVDFLQCTLMHKRELVEDFLETRNN